MQHKFSIVAGTANKPLADSIASRLGQPLCPTDVERFSDGEIRVEIRANVRGSDVYIIQPTCSPANDTLMELMLIVDALRKSSAAKITAVVPYFGYARQDRRPGTSRTPISASVAARMLESVGVDHVITIDLHATQIQGFFSIPVDNLGAQPLFVRDIKSKHPCPIIVSPDVGGVARARAVAAQLNNADLAIVDKRRARHNTSEVMNIIGDVEQRTCVIIDDMVDTAGTLAKAANALIEVGGASSVVAYATHGVLSGSALSNLEGSLLTELVITDTIPRMHDSPKIRQITTANLLAESITRDQQGSSLSELSNQLN